MAKVAFIAVAASAHTLEFVAGLNFAFVVRMGAIVRQSTFSMDEFLAYSVGGELIMVRS